MPDCNSPGASFSGLLVLFALMSSQSWASEKMPSRLYEVTTETGMPHLEENLRYTTTREKHCLSHQDLSVAFPILNHTALNGCKLGQESRRNDVVSYVLVCEGGHGTTGNATWQIGEHQIRGTLNVRLGGKNMTFYQRVTAKALGECG
jgi:hypothetical protein